MPERYPFREEQTRCPGCAKKPNKKDFVSTGKSWEDPSCRFLRMNGTRSRGRAHVGLSLLGSSNVRRSVSSRIKRRWNFSERADSSELGRVAGARVKNDVECRFPFELVEGASALGAFFRGTPQTVGGSLPEQA